MCIQLINNDAQKKRYLKLTQRYSWSNSISELFLPTDVSVTQSLLQPRLDNNSILGKHDYEHSRLITHILTLD